MRGRPFKMNVDLGGRKKAPEADPDFAESAVGANVRTPKIVDIVHNARLSKRARSSRAFLCGLEDELDRAFELVEMVVHPMCDSETDGCVPVVTAGMHQTRAFGSVAAGVGFMCRIVGFLHADTVDVKAERRNRARPARSKDGDAPREAPHFFQQRSVDAPVTGSFDRLFNKLRVSSHHEVGIDHGLDRKSVV